MDVTIKSDELILNVRESYLSELPLIPGEISAARTGGPVLESEIERAVLSANSIVLAEVDDFLIIPNNSTSADTGNNDRPATLGNLTFSFKWSRRSVGGRVTYIASGLHDALKEFALANILEPLSKELSEIHSKKGYERLLIVKKNILYKRHPEYTTSTASLSLSGDTIVLASSSQYTLTINSSVSWTLVENSLPYWITKNQGQPSSGTGNGTITFTIAANTGLAQRTGIIYVSGTGVGTSTISIAQAATISFSATLAGSSFTSSGGEGIITISGNDSWSISGVPSWITASKLSGTGAERVILYVNQNLSTTDDRSATVVVSPGTGNAVSFNITQSKRTSALSLSASLSTDTVTATGGNITLTIDGDDSWTINNLPAWITSSVLSGEGPKTVTLTVASGSSDRNATFSVTGTSSNSIPLTIYQGSTSAVTEIYLSSGQQKINSLTEFAAAGGTIGNLSVIGKLNGVESTLSSSDVTITIGDDTVTSSWSGTTLSFIAASLGANARLQNPFTIFISWNGHSGVQKAISASRAANDVEESISGSIALPTAYAQSGTSVASASGDTGTFVPSFTRTLTYSSGSVTTDTSFASHITIRSFNEDALTFNGSVGTWSANPDASTRTVIVQGMYMGRTKGEILYATQSAGQSAFTLTISPIYQAIGNAGGTITLNITSNDTWSLGALPSGISISSGSAAGTGNQTIVLQVEPNVDTESKLSSIVVNGTNSASQTLAISQSAQGSYSASASPLSLSPAYSGGEVTINITTNDTWSVTSFPSLWVSEQQGGVYSGSGNATIKYNIAANTAVGSTQRSGNIVIGFGHCSSITIPVTQAALARVTEYKFYDASTSQVLSSIADVGLGLIAKNIEIHRVISQGTSIIEDTTLIYGTDYTINNASCVLRSDDMSVSGVQGNNYFSLSFADISTTTKSAFTTGKVVVTCAQANYELPFNRIANGIISTTYSAVLGNISWNIGSDRASGSGDTGTYSAVITKHETYTSQEVVDSIIPVNDANVTFVNSDTTNFTAAASGTSAIQVTCTANSSIARSAAVSIKVNNQDVNNSSKVIQQAGVEMFFYAKDAASGGTIVDSIYAGYTAGTKNLYFFLSTNGVEQAISLSNITISVSGSIGETMADIPGTQGKVLSWPSIAETITSAQSASYTFVYQGYYNTIIALSRPENNIEREYDSGSITISPFTTSGTSSPSSAGDTANVSFEYKSYRKFRSGSIVTLQDKSSACELALVDSSASSWVTIQSGQLTIGANSTSNRRSCQLLLKYEGASTNITSSVITQQPQSRITTLDLVFNFTQSSSESTSATVTYTDNSTYVATREAGSTQTTFTTTYDAILKTPKYIKLSSSFPSATVGLYDGSTKITTGARNTDFDMSFHGYEYLESTLHYKVRIKDEV